MAIKRCKASIDVVEAARRRIKNVFSNGMPVYLSFSGGKDSIILADIVLKLIQRGEIRPDLLTVQFVDEEAIFACIEKSVLNWRKKFLLVGAKFEWYCVEVMHFNCFNGLTEEETYLCWDRNKRDVWVRQPPPFAITSHPLLRVGIDKYQDFMPRVCADGITILGLRASESVQRLDFLSKMNMGMCGMSGRRQIFPVYDWTTNDVWLYLLENQLDIPQVYLYMWQAGIEKNRLRVSQFFSTDTAQSLVRLNEFYPDLMERIIRREPNAYLAALYWDTEMFGRRTRARKELNAEDDTRDYKALLIDMFANMDKHFPTERQRSVAKRYRFLFMRMSTIATQADFQQMYDGLMKGDPKLRTLRALYQGVYGRYVKTAKEARDGGAAT